MVVQKKTYTLAEFEAICELPENRDRILELIEGEIVEKMPTNPYCSVLAARIVQYMGMFVDEHDLGYVTGADGGYNISEENSFAPDVGFISKTRQPELPHRGYNPIPPDLAVEVISPTDSYSDVSKKVAAYLRSGTQIVWVFDPETELVVVHTPDGSKTLGKDDTLGGGDVLPGFTLPINKIFRL